MAPTDRAFCQLLVADNVSFDKLEKFSERARRDIRLRISLTMEKLSLEDDIKDLFLLTDYKFAKWGFVILFSVSKIVTT